MIKLLTMAQWFSYLAALLMFLAVQVTVVSGAAQGDIALKLKLAREDLRLSEDTEERIKGELIRLKKSEKGSPEMIRYYETYLKRVQEMVKENRKAVTDMESAYTRHFPSSEPSSVLDMDISEEEEFDEVNRLDRQLNESLAEFDEMLHKELDVLALEIEQIRARTAQRMQQLAGEAAEAAKQARESGSNASLSSYGYGYGDEEQTGSEEEGEKAQGGQQGGQQGSQGGQQGSQGGQQGSQGGQQGSQGGQQGSQGGQQGSQGGQYGSQGGQQGSQGGQYGEQGEGSVQEGQQGSGENDGTAQSGGEQGRDSGDSVSGPGGSGAGGRGGGLGTDAPQEQVGQYDTQDDDIVARQLREAAENETDPELKEKLWKEYRDYKNGQ